MESYQIHPKQAMAILNPFPLINSTINCGEIEKFVEKPNLKNAQEMIKDKVSFGIAVFLFKANSILMN